MSNVLWPDPKRALRLRNATCVYCGCAFQPDGDTSPTREHVIGRRFVPKGSLNGGWNLIVNACTPCNNSKSDLEDDISAISMLPSANHEWSSNDPVYRAEAHRKASTHSRKTGKPVRDSAETGTIEGPFYGGSVKFTFIAPPRIDDDRLIDLAAYHVSAFFYLTTYDATTQRGHNIPGVFVLAADATRTDWGNTRLRGFTTTARSWPPRMIANGAGEYFRAMIRRRSDSCDLWAWALEWNRNRRLVGFFGEEGLVEEAANALPDEGFKRMRAGPNRTLGTRLNVALPEEEEGVLFFNDMERPGAG